MGTFPALRFFPSPAHPPPQRKHTGAAHEPAFPPPDCNALPTVLIPSSSPVRRPLAGELLGRGRCLSLFAVPTSVTFAEDQA